MKKRIWALLLAAVLLLGLLAGCGDKTEEDPSSPVQKPNSGDQQQAPAIEGKYAYKANFYPLDIGAEINYLNNFCFSGGNVFFSADCQTGEIVEETDSYSQETYSYEKTETRIFKLDMETHSAVRLEYTPRELPEDVDGNVYLDTLLAGKDGTLWCSESYSTYYFDLPEDFNPETDDRYMYYTNGESGTDLLEYDADGKFLRRLSLSAGEGISLSGFCLDGEGNFYATDWENFYAFDGEGVLLATLPNESYGDLLNFGGRIGVRYWTEEGKTMFKPIDLAAKAFGPEEEMSSRFYSVMPGVQGYQYLYNLNGVVFGHKDGAEEDEKLFSFLDWDVNSNMVRNFAMLEDGTVVGIEQDDSNGWPPKYNLLVMEQVDASTLPQKQVLTLACMYMDWDLRNEIIQFNRGSSDVRITVKDYSEYNTEDDYNAGLTKLNTEILSGILPDILYVNIEMPVNQYASKGILMDLWPLIDGDGELSRDDLMTHFFDVLSTDGKLYQITDGFSIETAVGLTKVVGDRTSWTLDEMLEVLATLEPGATIFGEGDTKGDILLNCVNRSLDQFINWSDPVNPCSFDSQEFIDMLNFANSFPKEFDWESFDWDDYEDESVRMRTGKQLLMRYYVSSFDQFKYMRHDYEEELSFVGYPSATGAGSYFNINGGLSITAACQNPEAAWSFVRYLLTEEHQENFWGFPSNRHVFETRKEASMKEEETADMPVAEAAAVGARVEAAVAVDGVMPEEDRVKPLTEADCQRIMDLYESCSTIYGTNEEVMNIINEEVEPFFDGQKTAEETAKLIQNRVSLYVAEQG